jgi:hypothetical protein
VQYNCKQQENISPIHAHFPKQCLISLQKSQYRILHNDILIMLSQNHITACFEMEVQTITKESRNNE